MNELQRRLNEKTIWVFAERMLPDPLIHRSAVTEVVSAMFAEFPNCLECHIPVGKCHLAWSKTPSDCPKDKWREKWGANA